MDRDAYLGIAENIAAGRGFCTPDTASPTAYRPPLYPLLLAATLLFLPAAWAVAAWNVLTGVGTVWLTDRLGASLGLGSARHIATLLVAIDPLLLNATPQPMTEVVFAFLTTAWLWAVICPAEKSSRRALLIGVLFGLMALCRPTIWPLAGLMAVTWFVRATIWRGRSSGPFFPASGEKVPKADEGVVTSVADSKRLLQMDSRVTAPPLSLTLSPGAGARGLVWMILGALLIVSPWVVRNQLVFGHPILTTTHGGYTLLLANNPVYDREVVQQPWGTIWSGESLAKWQVEIEQQLNADLGPHPTEPQRDAWMSAEAKEFIRENPSRFVQAALHRVRSLWSIAPHGEGTSLPAFVRLGVAAFYVVEFLLAVAGFWFILRRGEWPHWLPGLLLILTIQAVHLAYWTDARMRTPLEPVLALLAARGLLTLSRRTSEGDAATTPQLKTTIE